MTPTDKRRRRARIANAARERERLVALTIIALAQRIFLKNEATKGTDNGQRT